MKKSLFSLTDGIVLCIAVQILIGVAGCVSGNKGLEINVPEQPQSRLPETIEAAGTVAAGAWDRAAKLFGGRE